MGDIVTALILCKRLGYTIDIRSVIWDVYIFLVQNHGRPERGARGGSKKKLHGKYKMNTII